MPIATVVDAMLLEDVGVEARGVVVGVITFDSWPSPAKLENGKTSDDDGGKDDVCECATMAFNLSFGRSRSETVPDVAVVLESLRDAVTKSVGVSVAADEAGVRSELPIRRARVVGPGAVLCPDFAFEVV